VLQVLPKRLFSVPAKLCEHKRQRHLSDLCSDCVGWAQGVDMGADDEQTKPSSSTDVRFNWISDRTCSSLKIKEDSFQKLLASESRQDAPHLLKRSNQCPGWLSRVCSSHSFLRFRDPAEALVANCRPHLTSFLEDPDVLRLMIYMDGKDLAAVRNYC